VRLGLGSNHNSHAAEPTELTDGYLEPNSHYYVRNHYYGRLQLTESDDDLLADDPNHPIRSLETIDVYAVNKGGGATLAIVIASPLRADARGEGGGLLTRRPGARRCGATPSQ